MFVDNSWYSHRKVLAEYCNVKDRPVYASIQHGWFKILDSEVPNLKISKIPGNNFLCWSKTVEKQYKKNNLDNIVTIGAPFIYLYDDFNDKTKIDRETLIFPPHTGELEGRPSNFKSHKELIDYVNNKYDGPFSVCLYYQDMKDDIIKLYNKENWKIFSCGNRINDNFLMNFIKIVSRHENVLVCEMTSAYLYALYMKKNVKIIHEFSNKMINRTFRASIIKDNLWNYYSEYFPFFNNETNFTKKIEHVKFELGCSNKKSKKELKDLLGWNNTSKKIFSYLLHKIKKI